MRLAAFVSTHRKSVLGVVLLWLCLAVSERATATTWPWYGYAAPIAAALLVGIQGISLSRPFQSVVSSLPLLGVLAATGIGVHVFWLQLPSRAAVFAPLWWTLWVGGQFGYQLYERHQTTIWRFARRSAKSAAEGLQDPWVRSVLLWVPLDTLAAELALAASANRLASAFYPHQRWTTTSSIVGLLAWVIGRTVAGRVVRARPKLLAVVPPVAGWSAWAASLGLLASSADKELFVLLGWTAVAVALMHRLIRRLALTGTDRAGELIRWMLLLFLGQWLMSGFATPRGAVSGDAVWYSAMLADMVEQTRAGIFPV